MPVNPDINQVFVYPDGSTWTPLLVVIKHYNKSINTLSPSLLNLLYCGCNPNKTVKPLHDKKEQNVISLFLSLYDFIYIRPETLFENMLKYGANLKEGFRLYIDNGGDVNYIIRSEYKSQNFSMSLLWVTIHFQDIDSVKLLINKGADLNLSITPFPILRSKSCDLQGELVGSHRPLYFAIRQQDTSIAELLIHNNARI